jgi:hypothetical protein
LKYDCSGGDYDTDHYLVEVFRDRLAVSKQTTSTFQMVRFNPKILNKVEGKEQYWVEILNRLAALENSNYNMDISRAWETNRQNIKLSDKETLYYYELKMQKQWSDKGCSKLLNYGKQAKLQWLQASSQINGDNLNKVRFEANKNFTYKKREYLEDKIYEITMNSKNKTFDRSKCDPGGN